MRRHKNLLVALAVIVAVAGAISLGLHTAAEACLAAQRADEVVPAALGDPSQLPGAPRTGRFTAHLEFVSDAAPANAQLSTEVVWDDDWFFQDPATYNHELATACAAISAIANAESAYYQVGSGAPASMGRALEALGFEDVSTANYQCDNEALDELVDILTNTADVTAYSVASKRITNSETGATKTLLLVSVRGSYGSVESMSMVCCCTTVSSSLFATSITMSPTRLWIISGLSLSSGMVSSDVLSLLSRHCMVSASAYDVSASGIVPFCSLGTTLSLAGSDAVPGA